MTAATANPEKAMHSIQRRLKEREIDVIAIVDDAYDAPARENILDYERRDFIAEVNANDSLQTDLFTHGFLTPIRELEDTDLSDELLLRLWTFVEKNKDGEIARACNDSLFRSRHERLRDVNKLTEYLEELGLTVRKMTSIPEELDGSIKIVFLDYLLGPHSNSVAQSQKFADLIRHHSPNTFMVLMSSKDNLSETADLFRSQGKILRNLFDFAEKKDLTEREKLQLKLQSWVVGLPSRLKVRSFVSALESSISSVTADFLDKVRSLNLEDYAFTQKLSLQAEGQPLGEYMLWLHSNLIAELFSKHEAIIKEVKELDALVMEELLPFGHPPSMELAEIYSAAICQRLQGGWRTKSVKIQVGEKVEDFELPQIELGDILVKDGSSPDVYLIINAACDLIFSQERVADPHQSIILVPGTLYPLNDPKGHAPVRTELFLYRNNQHRIVWDLDRIRTEKHSELRAAFPGYEPLARLRLPYALEIQRAFSAKLTRIGMPVAPPFYHPVSLDVWAEDDKEKCKLLMRIPPDEGAVILHHGRKKDTFLLTIKCIERLMQCLDDIVQGPDVPARNPEATTKKQQALKMKQNFALWQDYITTPLDIPLSTVKVRDQISIHRNQEFSSEIEFKTISNGKCLLALNLRCGEGSTSKETKESKQPKQPKDAKGPKGAKGRQQASSEEPTYSHSSGSAEMQAAREEPAHV